MTTITTESSVESRAQYLHLTGEVQRREDGSIFIGDFIKNDVLFRCRGDKGLLDGGAEFAIQNGAHVEYWKDGKLSRPVDDGPAVVSLYGDYAEYWLDGKRIS